MSGADRGDAATRSVCGNTFLIAIGLPSLPPGYRLRYWPRRALRHVRPLSAYARSMQCAILA
eukprot:2920702-Rhodomonas_salina.3